MSTYQKSLLLASLKMLLLELLILTAARVVIYTFFIISNAPLGDIMDAFLLGLRLDLSVVAYTSIIPLLGLIATNFIRFDIRIFYKIYFFCITLLLLLIEVVDIGHYSFFGEHITMIFFGLFDDDTDAIIKMLDENYGLGISTLALLIVMGILYFIIQKIFNFDAKPKKIHNNFIKRTALYLGMAALVFIAARGTFGMYPISKMIEDVSEDPYINSLPQNGVFAFKNASYNYAKSKQGHLDIIKEMGYKGHIEDAFKVLEAKNFNRNNLLATLDKTTKTNPAAAKKPPHVVVIMVESFGMPILKYQSDKFDIMRRLKKHFDEDTVFTNFISTANGTIASLEPLLLNIIARPHTIPFGQSRYQSTDFTQAAARVYKKAGYETTFIYGGDLSWRNVGHFMQHQGFDHTYGKAVVKKNLHLSGEDIFHDWGIYDQFTLSFVEKKLKEAKKPQFIFVLTTNNHPPYKLYKNYKSKPLHFSKELRQHLRGDMDLIEKRLYDYQYALDTVGGFLDAIKSSPLKENTILAVTADNNTIEGIMKYDNPYEESKKIPFYIYMPAYLKRDFNTTLPGSHKDIFPTLYNLTLSNVKYRSMGSDLGDTNVEHCGYNNAEIILSKNGAFKIPKAKTAAQKSCLKRYKASLAAQEYMLQEEFKHQRKH